MSKFTIKLVEKGRCHIQHELAKAEILTDRPPEYGGKGRSFSSTDLVSAALGTCVMTSIDSIIGDEGLDISSLKITVEKKLNPKTIEAIELEIYYPQKLNDKTIKILKEAVYTSPVKLSLSEGISVNISFSNDWQ